MNCRFGFLTLEIDMKIIPTDDGPAIVDDRDFLWLLGFGPHWYVNEGYACIKINRKHTYMYRLIAERHGLKGEIDHQNRNKLDCQFINLREATKSQNIANSERQSNLAGFKGVSRSHRRKPWKARIMVNYVEIPLQNWDTPEEAARAYDRAAIQYFGEFACLNFPRSDYAVSRT